MDVSPPHLSEEKAAFYHILLKSGKSGILPHFAKKSRKSGISALLYREKIGISALFSKKMAFPHFLVKKVSFPRFFSKICKTSAESGSKSGKTALFSNLLPDSAEEMAVPHSLVYR